MLDACLEEAKKCVSACDALVSKLEAKILDRKRRIQLLEEEIEGPQSEILQEHKVKNENQTTIQTLRSTTSFIRCIPPEIVASIIEWLVILPHPECQHDAIRSACSVSKLWRDTALSAPSLWRSLYINLDTVAVGRSGEQAGMLLVSALDNWFSRGGEGARFDLTIACEDMKPKRRRQLVADLIGWFHNSSLNFISLNFDEALTLVDLQALLETQLPCFQSTRKLSLEARYLPLEESLPKSIELEFGLPKLRDLRLVGEEFSLDLLSHPRLTKLELLYVADETSNVLEALAHLPSLEWLLFDSCSLWTDGNEPLFTHHSLRRITVHHVLLGQFLTTVSCPLLERVDIENFALGLSDVVGEQSAARHAHYFGDFIQRSSRSDVTLHLGAGFPIHFLNTLFHMSSPKVTTLDLKSLSHLPMDANKNGTPLLIPSAIASIASYQPILTDDPDTFLSKLDMCLETPTNRTVSIMFGTGTDHPTARCV